MKLLLCETIKSGESLTRRILQKDYKETWWVHNLSLGLAVPEGAMCKRLTIEGRLASSVHVESAVLCRIMGLSYLGRKFGCVNRALRTRL